MPTFTNPNTTNHSDSDSKYDRCCSRGTIGKFTSDDEREILWRFYDKRYGSTGEVLAHLVPFIVETGLTFHATQQLEAEHVSEDYVILWEDKKQGRAIRVSHKASKAWYGLKRIAAWWMSVEPDSGIWDDLDYVARPTFEELSRVFSEVLQDAGIDNILFADLPYIARQRMIEEGWLEAEVNLK